MNILVTGSAGHLGEALMRTFRARGTDARGVDILPSPFTDVVGDIADRDVVDHCMQGITHVLHVATLHKPHVATHPREAFVATNISGTLNLLEAAVAQNVKAFVFTSTTSAFGDALTPPAGSPAAWITEDVVPIPKNIYGVTKTAAEDLCRLFHRNEKLPCLVLRTSRFFPEQDDVPERASAFDDANLKANEYLYRRADVADVVSALDVAMDRAPALGFGRFIVSATTPFQQSDLAQLGVDAPAALARYFPEYAEIYARRGWTMLPALDRVYVNTRAREVLGWQPKYDFAHVLRCVAAGEDYRSPLTLAIGAKGYHRTA